MQLRPFVLVVDDDTAAAERVGQWLSRHGYSATTAASVATARFVIGVVPVDVLVGHLALRDGSLFGLVRSLRAQRPVIAVGYADVEVPCAPELDACFVAPLPLRELTAFLDARHGRRPSGEFSRAPSPAVDDDDPSAVAARRVGRGGGAGGSGRSD